MTTARMTLIGLASYLITAAALFGSSFTAGSTLFA